MSPGVLVSSRFTHTLQEESSHPGAHNLSRVNPDWIGDNSGGENVVPEIKLLGYTEEKKDCLMEKTNQEWGCSSIIECLFSMHEALSSVSAPCELWCDWQTYACNSSSQAVE